MGIGYWVLGTGYGVLGIGYWALGTGDTRHRAWCRGQGAELEGGTRNWEDGMRMKNVE